MLRATFTKRGLIVAALGLAIISASAPGAVRRSPLATQPPRASTRSMPRCSTP